MKRIRPSEEVDVTSSLQADPELWLTLYRELGERVFRLLHRMTGDPDLAGDLTQDTFVRVFERAGQFEGRGALRSWVFRIAVNLARQEARTVRRRGELLDRARPVVERANPSGPRNVELRLTLEEAVAQLPDDLRTALLLHEIDGYTHAEIGEMTGVAEGSSKSRVSRAKAALREALDGKI